MVRKEAKKVVLKDAEGNYIVPVIDPADKGGSGLELCDIGMALYVDETKGLRRYLNGQIVDINTNTQAFLNRLLQIQTTNPDYFTTEDNWQSEATLNIDSCVYKFVLNYSGDNVVSVRLPKYPDFVEINAGGTLPVIGNGKALGITSNGSDVYYINTGTIGVNHMLAARSSSNELPSASSNTDAPWSAVATTVGVSTDSTKSGLVANLDQTKLKMRYFIQIATGSETENNIINEIELNNPYSLFDSKYSDHELNNLSWLKSEGQWNSGTVYVDAYNELLAEYNNAESVEETEGTVTFKSTPRGFRIADTTQEQAILNLYNTTGVAWYYILDTTNTRFKLPRTKYRKNTAPKSVPVTTSETRVLSGPHTSLMFNRGGGETTKSGKGFAGFTSDNILTSGYNTYGGNDSNFVSQYGVYPANLITEPITEEYDDNMYLYFYVGETVQNANLIDAGRIGEQLASKLDRSAVKAYITETYQNGTSWYRVWSDGWCEQGGYEPAATAAGKTITFLKPYKTAPNISGAQVSSNTSNIAGNSFAIIKTSSSITTTGFTMQISSSVGKFWEAKGYLAKGQY